MTIDRVQVESFLNFANKLQGAQEIARALMQMGDIEAEISTVQARLAQAKADADVFDRETAARRQAELDEHKAALAANNREYAQALEAAIKAANEKADAAQRAHEQDMRRRQFDIDTADGRLQGVRAAIAAATEELSQVDADLQARRVELANVENQLATARETIASLLKA